MAKQTHKRQRKKGNLILTLVLIVAIAVFCFAAYHLYNIYTEYKKGTDEYHQIEQIAVTGREPDSMTGTADTGGTSAAESNAADAEPEPPIRVDFDALKKINEDVVGWIYIEALDDVSYPVVQGKDNETYLHATFEKKKNSAGAIFIDCANRKNFSDCNTLVYGHNMKNGSMFGQLKKFIRNQETYKTSKYFWILTPGKNYRYEIVSAYTTQVDSDTYTLFPEPSDAFQKYLDTIKSKSEISTDNTALTSKDRIVTLSTCTGSDSDRLVVQGKQVNAEAVS